MAWTPHSSDVLSAAGADSVDTSLPVSIIYPGSDGITRSNQQGMPQYNSYNNDPYGGQTINISTGNSAQGLNTLSGVLGSGFEGLFDMISKNTDKNNAFSAAQAQRQMDFQERMQQIAMDFNSLEAAKNREWQAYQSNTAHQREVADLQAAGLNPILSASGGNGAAVGSGATAAGAAVPSGAKADPDQSMNSALASVYGALISAQTQMYNANLSAQTNLKMAEMQQDTAKYAAQLSADASKYAAGTNYAAQTYSANKNYENSEAQRQWNTDHPSNIYQAATSIAGGNSGVTGAKRNAGSILNTLASWILDR